MRKMRQSAKYAAIAYPRFSDMPSIHSVTVKTTAKRSSQVATVQSAICIAEIFHRHLHMVFYI